MKKVLFLSCLMPMVLFAGCNNLQTEKEVFGYLRLEGMQANGNLQMLFDELLYISGNDTETLLKYGFSPEDVTNDYELYNEKEEWLSVELMPNATFSIIIYVDDMYPAPTEVNFATFKQYMLNRSEILAKIKMSGKKAHSVYEVYVP